MSLITVPGWVDGRYFGVCGAGGRRAIVRRPVPLERDGVGGTLATTAQLDAGPGTSGPSAGGSVDGAGQFDGGQGAQGVTRVVEYGLPAMH